jgi:hypothetical protein
MYWQSIWSWSYVRLGMADLSVKYIKRTSSLKKSVVSKI